jgi:hypothetical protein
VRGGAICIEYHVFFSMQRALKWSARAVTQCMFMVPYRSDWISTLWTISYFSVNSMSTQMHSSGAAPGGSSLAVSFGGNLILIIIGALATKLGFELTKACFQQLLHVFGEQQQNDVSDTTRGQPGRAAHTLSLALKLDQTRVALGAGSGCSTMIRGGSRMLEMKKKFRFDLEPSRNNVCLKAGVVCCETPLDHDKAEHVGLAMLLFGAAAMKHRCCRWWLVRPLRSFCDCGRF